ncbi:hypothetical protein A3C89_00875 [Candidatus Kaiserbacteria bacterium RIFCSPHIGHO2_02_FULL_50_50]|uniref:Uncharacterized protein n=1 Tax=Candidatus Kaiserbacteria bacterium RIFCSPHIGHO2_02_FULL_50_50 TaxID=1798492 RepID=A0A1F6DFT4_9BACT|nr:MAG: hypothetical protein A3C89_00875 [Candidatus Kaiserbacteria bacterium RIFCSPHIGHO2_02_FULL_50_50]OGG88917.1 MAG: hypothetical protein A3G62_02750 [Candidatus Kaiserbacteria bacterium RIFCSPLOWO2_12_FULL_50_10]
MERIPSLASVERIASREGTAIAAIDKTMGAHESLSDVLEIKMHMQLALAMAHDEDMEHFIEEHRHDSFRKVFDMHPEYLTRYIHDPESVLREVGAQVYH